MVSPVTFRPASVLAKSVVTVDHVSSGRVELGIGAGWYEAEHRPTASRSAPPGSGSTSSTASSRRSTRQWTDGEDIWPKPLQQPRPPIIVGGTAKPRTVRAAIALRRRIQHPLPDRRGSARARRRRRGRPRGRPPTARFSIMIGCLVGRDEARSGAAGRLPTPPAGTTGHRSRARSTRWSSSCARTRPPASSAPCSSTSHTRTSRW